MTGLGLGFQWKGQKEKGLLPVGSVELGSSTNVLRDLLELAQWGGAGNAQCPQLTNLALWGRKTLSRKYCLRPPAGPGTTSQPMPGLRALQAVLVHLRLPVSASLADQTEPPDLGCLGGSEKPVCGKHVRSPKRQTPDGCLVSEVTDTVIPLPQGQWLFHLRRLSSLSLGGFSSGCLSFCSLDEEI